MKLKRTKQCAKCPWRVDVDPHDIPDGYCEAKHAALESTIATEGDFSFLSSRELRIMACHETGDTACVGWLANQLGPGNNIGLRIAMSRSTQRLQLVGEQHKHFRDTLPVGTTPEDER